MTDKPAVIEVGKTCEISCGGDHYDDGKPKENRLTGEGNHTITITCQADNTWSGMPDTPRSCEAICDSRVLSPEVDVHFKWTCTDEDKVGSKCTKTCLPGYEFNTFNKYAPKTELECKGGTKGWIPNLWKITGCYKIKEE